MAKTYNLYNLEAPFKEYLDAGNQKPVSIKNYISDIRHFFGWLISTGEETSPLQESINTKIIFEYKSYLESNNIPHKTINRRLSTLRKFCSFCISQGWMKENPAKKISNISHLSSINHHLLSNNKASESPEFRQSFPRRWESKLKLLFKNVFNRLDPRLHGDDKKPATDSTDVETQNFASLPHSLQQYVAFLIILIFMAVMGAGIYNQFFVKNRQSLAYPTTLTKAGRILSFQGRLTDTLSNPITTATNVVFQLYSVSSGGVALYNTGSCSVTPDQDGIFNSLIGSDCGAEIASSVFSENVSVYLGVTVGADAEMTPRQQIANVGYAINSETLQGLPPGSNVSNIPYINSQGNLLIAASNPNLASTYASSTFTISSAQATTIQSAGTGDIVLQATESGTLKFRTGGATDANTRITVDNVGLVGIGTTTPGQELDIVGDLQFSGALMPNSLAGSSGQFLISSGAGVAPTWTSTIAASSIPFSGITSGTNTTAAMVVGAGATLDYTSTGTINSSSLIGGTWAAPGTIGSGTPNTGAFTTLSSTGNTTLGTGASSINTIGSTTTPGTLTLHGATTLDNTFTVSGSNLTSLGGDLTVTGTAWTATPTISGAVTMTSGFDSNSASTVAGLTVDTNGNLTVSNGTLSVTAPSTTGNAAAVVANSLTTGNVLNLSSTSTAGGASGVSKILNISRSGANAQLDHTAYGLYSDVTNTNVTSGTNIAGYFSASGATTANYGLIVAAGSVGIGDTSPDAKFEVLGTTEQLRLTYTDGTVDSKFTVDASGNLTIDNTGTKTIVADDLQITGGDILDSNGNESIRFGTTASAVNEATLTNAATGGTVTLAATGGDTDVAFSIDSKGADALNLNGTATGDILLGGGSGSTGCTLTNSTGEFTCTILTASSLKWNALTVPDGNLTLAMDADTTTFNWDTLTTGTGWTGASTSLSSGTLESLSVNSTAATGNTQKVLSLSTAGANATSTQTTYGLYTTNTHTGTASTNIGGYFSASGGTNNYAAIFESGNVGIGTTAPAQKLEVLGTVRIDNTAAAYFDLNPVSTSILRFSGTQASSNFQMYDGTNDYLIDLYSGANDNVRIMSNGSSWFNGGNVGIGTTSPTQKFSVFGGNVDVANAGTLGSESLTNGALTAGTSWTQTTDCALVTDAATCTFAAGTASTVQQASGTLAVAGVGSRWYKLVYTVSGITGTPVANITTAFASATTALNLTAGTQTTYFQSAASPTDFVITTTLTAGQAFTLDDLSLKEVQGGDLALGGILTGGGTTGLKVLANGNVGIGTTTPSQKLEILDSSAIITYPLSLLNNYGAISDLDGVGVKFGRAETQPWGAIIGVQTTPSDFNGGKLLFQTETSDALGLETKMVIDKTGNVGIGTTAPSQQLELTGDLKIGGDDLFMATNTANYFLMADGTNYNPVTPAAARTGLGLDSGGAGDIWVDVAGDTMTGDLTMSGTTANINLGSNYLSGDGGDEGVFVESTGNVGIGITAPGNMKLRVEGNVRAASYYDTGDLTDTYFLNPAGSSSFGGSLTLVGQLTFNGTLEANANTIQLLSSASTAVCVGDATCTGKIDAGTVDPPYTINGKNYATFLPSMTGVKEETTGIITLNSKNPSTNVYESMIDFAGQPEASDLWLFAKVTDLKKNIDQMTVLLTPSENTRSWYKVDKENLRLYVYSSRPTNISYRLTAPRFDSEQWSNRRADDARAGFIINDQGDVNSPPSSVSYNKPEISPQNFVYDGNIENFKQSNSLYTLTGDFIDEFTSVTEALIARLKVGFIETENIVVNQTLVAKKIISPVVETDKVVTNEIKSKNGDLVVDLGNVQTPKLGVSTTDPNAGKLAKLIIKGLAGKTAVVIDAGGNASFSGQIIADTLQINNDATVAGNLVASDAQFNNVTMKQLNNEGDASISGKLVAGTIESSTINDIQALLADIKNQPIPNLTNETNLSNVSNLESLTVTGNSNLYNVSVSGSLLVGTTLIDQNSIISLASELKLSALSTINFFDGAVIIAKDGKITTRGEIIAEGGIRTNEIKPLTDDGRVSINNLTISNLAIDNISTNSAVIAASDNFAQNGIFAPAIETATASAGIGILPENSSEIIIYNNTIKDGSLIYLTPTSTSTSVSQLTVGEKSIGTKSYFKVISNTPSTLPTKFNWLIIN